MVHEKSKMCDSVKDIKVFACEEASRNFDSMIENAFGLTAPGIKALLKKHGGMISGGLALKCYTASPDEDLRNYDGDCDIWIPLMDAHSSEDYSKKFETMNDGSSAIMDFTDYLVGYGYQNSSNRSSDLSEIGKALLKYDDYRVAIMRLNKMKVEHPEFSDSFEETIQEMKRLSTLKESDRNEKNHRNNERLKILFEQGEDSRSLIDEIREREHVDREARKRECIATIPLRDTCGFYPMSGDVSEFCETLNLCEKSEGSMYLTPGFYRINICLPGAWAYTNLNSLSLYKHRPQLQVINVNSNTSYVYISAHGEYVFNVGEYIKDDNSDFCGSIDRKCAFYSKRLEIIEDMIARSVYPEQREELIMARIEAREKLEIFTNHIRVKDIKIPNSYRDRLGFEKIFRIVRFTHMAEREIQVIFTFVDNHKMLQLFDLSFCAVGYDGTNFHAMEPELTKQKIGYRVNYRAWEREKERSKKYISRGFKIFKTAELTDEVTLESIGKEFSAQDMIVVANT